MIRLSVETSLPIFRASLLTHPVSFYRTLLSPLASRKQKVHEGHQGFPLCTLQCWCLNKTIALYFTGILASTKVPMPRFEIDVDPCDHITADAIGKPGQRVFYIQAFQDQRTITVIIEKAQLHSLAIGVEQFLAQVDEQNPDLSEASGDYVEEVMRINPPVDPLFRVGEIGLGYDKERDLVVLFVQELLTVA